MAGLIYLFDTNAMSDLIEQNPTVIGHVRANQRQILCLCAPVHYEVRRGLLHVRSTRKTQIYETQVRPLFEWARLEDDDWEQAAKFWAEARGKGKQLSDVDLVIAALAARLEATIVSADNDFDTLPVKRENWRV
jgi:predicted nucleic acid-binding protein